MENSVIKSSVEISKRQTGLEFSERFVAIQMQLIRENQRRSLFPPFPFKKITNLPLKAE